MAANGSLIANFFNQVQLEATGADISATFSELEHIWERFDIFGKIEDE